MWTLIMLAAITAPGQPTALRCEYLTNPLGIDTPQPRFFWEVNDPRRGAVQSAYQVLVASTPENLAADRGDVWDSGQVASDQSIQVPYGGAELQSRRQYFWKVRTWDAAGQGSPWSEPAFWGMGLLKPADWKARWIGLPNRIAPPIPAHSGYHSEVAASPEQVKWVVIDLGDKKEFDAVRLVPSRSFNGQVRGFLYPVRFRIEVCDSPACTDARAVVDLTQADVPNPGDEPQTYRFPRCTGRYVRLLVTRLALREPKRGYGFTLAEFEVLNGEQNIALNCQVQALDSIEDRRWSTRKLTDGILVWRDAAPAKRGPGPMVRKPFTLAQPPKRATLFVTALGLYECWLNGQRVGDQVLAPEWTDYRRQVQYQTYDVTGLLKGGPNAIGAILADGWYAGRVAWFGNEIFGQHLWLLAQLEIELADGTRETIVSDETWHGTTDGPIVAADILDGETYDARLEQPGWNTAGFDDSGGGGKSGSWKPVDVADLVIASGTAPSGPTSSPDPAIGGKGLELTAQPNEPIRVTGELKPVALTEPQPGVFVFDLGQNGSGWARLRTRGPAGTRITLQFAEMLKPDGTVYTANLRSAACRDTFILCGEGEETFEPRFTYRGYRYVQVTGLAEKPTRDALVGRVVHSSAPAVGTFECSSPLLNKLLQNVNWTQISNMEGTPTDCPQRDERLGWMGDAQVFAQTACFNRDMAAFYTKWARDIREAQAPDGRYSDFSPNPALPNGESLNSPGWADAGLVIPWRVYENYADTRILAQQFESARAWIDYVHRQNPDLTWTKARGGDFGDWLSADTLVLEDWPKTGGEVPKEVFATLEYARSTALLARMAAVLGRDDDARKYAELHAGIKEAFQRRFVAADGRLPGDTQAGYALALAFDLLPAAQRPAAVEYMMAGFARYHDHISTGFNSTLPMMRVLADSGHLDMAYRLVNNRTIPSWGYMIDQGATTLWERWDGYVEGRGFQDPGMNSFSHYAFGAVGEWTYRVVAGINPDEQQPGYRHFIIRPQPGGGLTYAKTTYHSIRGPIVSDWKLAGGKFTLDLTVPANTRATVFVPAPRADAVTEGGQPLSKAEAVELVGVADGAVQLRVGAGRYQFEAPAPQ